MNVRGGALEFDAVIRNTDFKRQLDEMSRQISGLSNKVRSETSSMDDGFRKMATAAAGFFTISYASQFAGQLVKVRGEFQQLEVAFTTMLRSKSKADALMQEAVAFAAKTPFKLSDIAQGAKQLIAYGSASTTVIDELEMLGNIASGVSAPLNEIVYLYGTLRTQGRAYTMDIRQFAGRGIPIYTELAKVLNVNVSEVNNFVEAGKVGFAQVEQALRNMTSQGGMFQGLMREQSKTLTGLTSNFQDAWDSMLNSIGKDTEGVIGTAIKTATTLVQHYEAIGKTLFVLVASYGAAKAAMIAYNVISKETALISGMVAEYNGYLTTSQALQKVWTERLTIAQAKLNATMLANPYVLLTMAVVGLGVAIWALYDSTTALEKAQKQVNDAMDEQKKIADEQKTKTESLIATIRNETETLLAKIQALKELQKLYPAIFANMTVEQVKAAKLNDLSKKLNQERDKKQKSELVSNYDNEIEKIKNLKESLKNIPVIGDVSTIQSRQSKIKNELEVAEQAAKLLKDKINELEKAEWDANTPVEAKKKHYENIRDELQKQLDDLNKIKSTSNDIFMSWDGFPTMLDKVKFDGIVNELDKVKSLLNGFETKKPMTVSEKIADLKNRLRWEEQNLKSYKSGSSAYDKESISKTEASIKELKDQLETLGVKTNGAPFGSLEYWDEVAKKAQEIINKTPGTDTRATNERNRQTAIKLEAEKNAENIRKKITVRSFNEELEYKKKQYQLYEKWVEHLGKTIADNEFKELIQNGAGYTDYLQKRISEIKSKVDSGTANETDFKIYNELKTEYSDASGSKTAIEIFRESLESAKNEAKTLTEYLEILRQKQSELSGDKTGAGVEKNKVISGEIISAESERQKNLNDFLESVKEGEEKKTSIKQKYDNLRIALEKKYSEKTSKEYISGLEKINKAEFDENANYLDEMAKKGKLWEELNDMIGQRGVDAIKKRISQLKQLLTVLQKGSDLYKETEKELKTAEIDLNTATLSNYKELLSIVNQIGKEFEGMGGNGGKIGRVISGLTFNLDKLMITLDKSSTKEQKTQAAIQAGGDFILEMKHLIDNSKAARDAAAADYANAIVQQAKLYDKYKNEQIRMSAAENENPFIKDYAGRLEGAAKAAQDAREKFAKSLEALRKDGKAIVGQEDVVNWDTAHETFLSGSNTGATAGTAAAPGWGTLIGAIVGGLAGGLTGLFGAKDKKNIFAGLLDTYKDLIITAEDGTQTMNYQLAQSLIDTNKVDDATKELIKDAMDWSKAIDEANQQIKDIISELAGQLGNELRTSLVDAFKSGEDAATAFGDSFSKVVENMVTQLIISKILGPELDKLSKEMEESVKPGGDQNWVDDMGRFYEKMPEVSKKIFAGLEGGQKEAKKYGMNILDSSVASQNSLSGAIKGVSEETASVLAGQINAMRINQTQTKVLIEKQLIHLSEIAANTRYNKYLESIDAKIGKMQQKSDPLRSQGVTNL